MLKVIRKQTNNKTTNNNTNFVRSNQFKIVKNKVKNVNRMLTD